MEKFVIQNKKSAKFIITNKIYLSIDSLKDIREIDELTLAETFSKRQAEVTLKIIAKNPSRIKAKELQIIPLEINLKETPEQKEARRKEIIETINCRLDDMEVSAFLLGTEEDRHLYADAIVGITEEGNVVYEGGKVILALMEVLDCSYEDASDWYGCNTVRSLPYLEGGKEDPRPPIIIDMPAWD